MTALIKELTNDIMSALVKELTNDIMSALVNEGNQRKDRLEKKWMKEFVHELMKHSRHFLFLNVG